MHTEMQARIIICAQIRTYALKNHAHSESQVHAQKCALQFHVAFDICALFFSDPFSVTRLVFILYAFH